MDPDILTILSDWWSNGPYPRSKYVMAGNFSSCLGTPDAGGPWPSPARYLESIKLYRGAKYATIGLLEGSSICVFGFSAPPKYQRSDTHHHLAIASPSFFDELAQMLEVENKCD